MNGKIHLILSGSLIFLICSLLKSKLYVIDIVHNLLAFPLYLIIYVFSIHSTKEKQDISYPALHISLLLYIAYTIRFSLYVFVLHLLIYSIIFLVYKTTTQGTLNNICVNQRSFLIHIRENRQYYKVPFLILCTVIYYAVVGVIILLGGITFSPEFW